MGKPGYTYDDQKQQAESLSAGAPMVPTGNNSYYTGDAVVIYLLKQGVPLDQAESLATSLRRGGQDDLGIQGSAAAQVAERELTRMKTLSRYLDLEKRAGAGDQLDRRDQAFLSAVRARHQELIRDRAFMAEAEAQERAAARQASTQRAQQAESQKMAALKSQQTARQGQQLEATGDIEINRMRNMREFSRGPGGAAMSPDGQHAAFTPQGAAHGEPAQPGMGEMIQQKLFGQAKTAAAIAQQFGIPPDAAAQLASQLHTMPTPASQVGGGGLGGIGTTPPAGIGVGPIFPQIPGL